MLKWLGLTNFPLFDIVLTKCSSLFLCDSQIHNPGETWIHSGIHIQAWTDTETDAHQLFNPYGIWIRVDTENEVTALENRATGIKVRS